MLCCAYTLTDFPKSIRLTSLALWQSNDCPSASKATLMNMDKYFMWIHYERLRNHNKAKHNKTVCIFLGIYCTSLRGLIVFMNTTGKWSCCARVIDAHGTDSAGNIKYFAIMCVALVAIIETIRLAPYNPVKSLQLISCNDLGMMRGYQDSMPRNGR